MFKRMVLILVVLLCFNLQAQTIHEILFKGNQRIESTAIAIKTLQKVGQALDQKLIQASIHNIYSMGYFENIKVDFEPSTGVLIFHLVEKKLVKSVRFEGHDKLDAKDFEDQIKLKALDYFDDQAAHEDVERIKSVYEQKGYFLVTVDTVVTELDQALVSVVYKISENKKIKIERISFNGNRVFKDKDLKAVMFTKEKGFLSFLSGSGSFQNEMLEQDRQLVRDFYGRNGYIDARVSNPLVTMSANKQSMSVLFNLEEGEKYSISSVDIEDHGSYAKEKLLSKISVQANDVADTSKIQKDIFELSGVYADDGYAFANVIPQDRRDEEKKTIDLVYRIEPGQKVMIRYIQFIGNDVTRDKVLRREMELAEGDVFSRDKLRLSKANIDRLALFEEVKMSTPRGANDNEMDIVIEVKEKQTGTFSIGAGFNTIESFQVLGRIEKRNLFGYGVDLSLDARVGGRTQAFNLQYRDENFFDSKWGLTVNAFNIDRRFSNFDLTSRGGSLGFDYPLYQKGLERVRLGLTYSYIDQNLQDLRPTVENLFKSGKTGSVTTAISRDTRNRVFEPSKGSFLKLSEEIASDYLGGTNQFSKSEFDGRWFFSPFDTYKIPLIKDSIFAFHVGAGYVTPLSDGGQIPLFERYFPGGILSLRGFQIRSLGPKINIASSSNPSTLETSDFVIGGNKELIFNAEYIIPLIKPANISGVLFFDMGNAFDNGESLLTLSGQRQSVGFGLRWFSPIGPLRFEWGYPLDRKEDESKVVFDFTIGSLF